MKTISLALVLTIGLDARQAPVRGDSWTPVTSVKVQGVLGERIRIWREVRLWRVIEDPFVMESFAKPPGTHAWQGEHAGKWLHAATLAYESTRDPKLLNSIQETARKLIAAQQPNGYIGTYEPAKRFFAPPGAHSRGSWDLWTARYVLYGLLVYENHHPDPAVVKACERLGDLLVQTFGPGGRKLTDTGTRYGMSSSTLLESIMMLYERTGERRFLDFAQHLHRTLEEEDRIKLITVLGKGGDVSGPGDGKAYQLMANLLGYGEMYRHTGENAFLNASVKAWENIRAEHMFETGGPWGYKSDKIKNVECFTDPKFYHPANPVENCTTTTWVQHSLQLLRMTGKAQYGAEAERAMLNQLIGSQAPNGRDWAYYTYPNAKKRDYDNVIHCCGSSGPRALEMYAQHLMGSTNGALSMNSYLPMQAKLSVPGIAATGLTMESDYPFADRTTIRLDLKNPARFAVDFRLPAGARSAVVTIAGKKQALKAMPSGYLRLTRQWKPMEAVEVKFDFPLTAHFHTDRDGKRHVGFTRGPLAFSQDGGEAVEVPVKKESADGSLLVDEVTPGRAYRIKGTSAMLMPYYAAGGTGASVTTYFGVKGGE